MDDRITTRFNALLIAYLSAQGMLAFAISARAKGVSIDGIVMSTLLDFVRYMVVLLISTWFLREFWFRLISPMFRIRPIEFREAMAILLMLAVMRG